MPDAAARTPDADGSRSRELLNARLQLVRRPGPGPLRYEIVPLRASLSFDKGLYLFIRAIQMLASRTEGLVFVGVAGPSGAGKTVFCEKVKAFIPGVALITMDMFNDASRLVEENFDDPRIPDYDLLIENITGLATGASVEVPVYDFKTSRRTGYRTLAPPAARVVIVEGIYALCNKLRPYLDLRVSVTGGVHLDLIKRVLRDTHRSAQQPEEIIQQVSETVYPMYKLFIEPDLATAHLKVSNAFNPFAGFQNATYILKSAVPVSEDRIRAVLGPGCRREASASHDIYLLPPSEDPETCGTWLRMRARNGRYSLMFEEFVTDGSFIISPRIYFEVGVRVLGGLLALGYEIFIIMNRESVSYSTAWNAAPEPAPMPGSSPPRPAGSPATLGTGSGHGSDSSGAGSTAVEIKTVHIDGLGPTFTQVQGKSRSAVAAAGAALGLDGSYIARSYIEQVQLEKLTATFRQHSAGAQADLQRRLTKPGGDDGNAAAGWGRRSSAPSGAPGGGDDPSGVSAMPTGAYSPATSSRAASVKSLTASSDVADAATLWRQSLAASSAFPLGVGGGVGGWGGTGASSPAWSNAPSAALRRNTHPLLPHVSDATSPGTPRSSRPPAASWLHRPADAVELSHASHAVMEQQLTAAANRLVAAAGMLRGAVPTGAAAVAAAADEAAATHRLLLAEVQALMASIGEAATPTAPLVAGSAVPLAMLAAAACGAAAAILMLRFLRPA